MGSIEKELWQWSRRRQMSSKDDRVGKVARGKAAHDRNSPQWHRAGEGVGGDNFGGVKKGGGGTICDVVGGMKGQEWWWTWR